MNPSLLEATAMLIDRSDFINIDRYLGLPEFSMDAHVDFRLGELAYKPTLENEAFVGIFKTSYTRMDMIMFGLAAWETAHSCVSKYMPRYSQR